MQTLMEVLRRTPCLLQACSSKYLLLVTIVPNVTLHLKLDNKDETIDVLTWTSVFSLAISVHSYLILLRYPRHLLELASFH